MLSSEQIPFGEREYKRTIAIAIALSAIFGVFAAPLVIIYLSNAKKKTDNREYRYMFGKLKFWLPVTSAGWTAFYILLFVI